jgi:hypothetical protein
VFALALLASALSAGSIGAADTRPVPLVSLAPKRIAYCERSTLLRAACPRLVPRVRAAYGSHLALDPTKRGPRVDIFNLERGGEYPAQPELNRPPRMSHLVIAGGVVERVAPIFEDLVRARPVRLRNGLMRSKRVRPLSFGRVRWKGLAGDLFLAPSYPLGGMLGNHLVFRWGVDRRYLVSLHGWEPLTEAAATLRAIVASTPAAR